MQKINKAFSIVELAAVVFIIGILIVGVTQGASMVRGARIANARSITSKSIVPKTEGLVTWYETSSIDSLKASEMVDGSQLTTWYDINPNSITSQRNSLTKSATSSVTYNISGINKLPSIEFNGTSGITLSSFFTDTVAKSTIFLVFKPSYVGNPSVLLDSYNSGSTSSISIKSSNINLNAGTSADTATGTNSASFVAGNSYIVAVYFNSSSSAAYSNNPTTSAGSATINPGTNALSGLTIGAPKGGSTTDDFQGLISEIIVFNRILKTQERKDIMIYLSKKYKITLSGI